MSTHNRKKLTGWLILLIVVIGPLQFSGASKGVKAFSDDFKPLIIEFPWMSTAIVSDQLMLVASAAVWAYTALVLYRRVPRTLPIAQSSFLCGAVLRILSGFSIPLLGGLPSDSSYSMVAQMLPDTALMAGILAAWYLYLIRSQKVREIYTD